MTAENETALRVEEKLTAAANRIVEQARAEDRAEAQRLLRARAVSFGISLLAVGAGLFGVAAFVRDNHPRDAMMICGVALLLWIVGAAFLDWWNALRAQLARKLLGRAKAP